ncbi:MAG: ABC transporter substrate-binding protein, partial [Anaerolineae bacterium]
LWMALLLVAAGCVATAAAPPAAPAGEAEQPAPVEQPAEAKPMELTVGIANDQYRLEGDGANLGVYPFNTNIAEPLVRLTSDYQIIPWLAERWEYVGDNTWRFGLRQGVKFHNGDEFDAEAAKWSLEKNTRWQGLVPTTAENIKVVDKYTLELTTSVPFGRVLENLVHPTYAMYSPKGDPGKNPIGTGPFKLDEYKQNEFIRVVKNEDYWGEPAQLDAITFRFIPDNSARILALQSGDVDMVSPVPQDNASQVQAMPDVQLHVSKPSAYYALYFATQGQEPPYDLLTDVQLRKAINYAIDRETIVNKVYDGFADVAKSLTPPVVFPAINAGIQGFSYDLAQAKALLAEAGWTDSDGDGVLDKDGQPLKLILVSGFPPANLIKPLPEVIQGQLKDIGIDVELKEFNDVGAYYDFVDTGEFHMVIEAGNWNTADVSFLPYTLFCGCNPEGEAILYQRFWINDEFDQAIQDAQATVDEEEATAAAVRTARIWVDEYTSVAPVAYIPQIAAAKSYLKGFQIHPSRISQNWATLRIEQ